MSQLGQFTRQLSQIRFSQIGSLTLKQDDKQENIPGKQHEPGDKPLQTQPHEQPDTNEGSQTGKYTLGNGSRKGCELSIGPCLGPAFTWLMRDQLENLDRGPFASERDYFEALSVALSRHAQELPMSYHGLLAPLPTLEEYDGADMEYYKAAHYRWSDFVSIQSKLDFSRNRFSYCLAAEILRERVVPQLVQREGRETNRNGQGNGDGQQDSADNYVGDAATTAGYPLMHPDLHVGNIFVDDDMNITCIIDWTSTTTVPMDELFGMPCIWMEKESQMRAILRENTSAVDPTHLPDPPSLCYSGDADDFWARANKIHIYQRLVRFCSSHDHADFRDLVTAGSNISASDVGDFLLDLFEEHAQRPENKLLLAELQKDDQPPERIAEKERPYFRESEWRAENDSVAVARKLTVMWHLNPRFFADKRLWKWLIDALECGKTTD